MSLSERTVALLRWRFLFPLVLLAFTVVVQAGWIGRIGFLSGYVGWPALQVFLAANNEGFFLAALIAFYMEVVRPNTFSDFFRLRLETLDAFLGRTSAREGVRFFLERHYADSGDPLRAGDLVDYVVSDKPILRNCDVQLWLELKTDAAGARAQQRYRLRYEARLDEFVFAVARSSEVMERLLREHPQITEIVLLDQEADFAAAAAALMAAQPVRMNEEPMRFSRWDEVDEAALAAAGLRRGPDYEMHLARVPPARLGRPNSYSVEFHASIPVAAHGTAYWMCDRPMHVRSISIDVSDYRLSPPLGFDLRVFLGSVQGIRGADFAGGECLLTVNRWLVHGQGVCVVWHPRLQAPTLPAATAAR